MTDSFLGLKVFAVCNHPGGVNAIVPVLTALREKGAQCCVVTGDYGLKRCAREGIPAEAVHSPVSYEAAMKMLDEYSPDCVLLGTSEPADPQRGRLEALFLLLPGIGSVCK